MKTNKQFKYLFSILFTVVLSTGIVFAWTGLQANPNDSLTASKWNELIDKVDGIFTDGSGNVGIGTLVPEEKLHILNGRPLIETNQDLKLIMKDNGGLQEWGLNMSADQNLKIYDRTAGKNFMTFEKGTGRVGIGTTSPVSKLSVDKYEDGGTIFTMNYNATNNFDFAEWFHNGDRKYRFYGSGNASTDGSWSTGGADYAEWFEKDGNIGAGELVGLNLDTGKARKFKIGDVYLGIQSLNPGFIGNNIDGADTDLEKIKETHVLVALVGQVELRDENFKEEGRKVSTLDDQFIGYRLSDGNIFIK